MVSEGRRAHGPPEIDDHPGAGPSVVVNGRFRRQSVTGVQRYATEIARRLPALLSDVTLAEPGRSWPPARGGAGAVLGHLWEQVVLPLRLSHRRGAVLLSLCNWGPITVRRQVLVLHDLAPLRVPSAFSREYVARFRTLGLATARRVAHLVTPSRRMAAEIAEHLDLDPDRVSVIAPGVHRPPVGDPVGPRGAGPPFALFVGAHDPRKGLDAVRRWWPEAHRRTGLELVVTGRGAGSVFRTGAAPGLPGCRLVIDPHDDVLWNLYARARMVLSPSRYEGFGLPLLEALSCGTPFLSSDTGAAADLALRPWWLVPAVDDAWVAAVDRLCALTDPRLEDECRALAASYTWDRAAAAFSRLLRDLGAQPSL